MPSTLFWFGQMMPQTFRNMMIASQMPTLISVKPYLSAVRPPARPKVKTLAA